MHAVSRIFRHLCPLLCLGIVMIALEARASLSISGMSCTKTSSECIEGAETRQIDGVPVHKECWKHRASYQCRRSGSNTSCQSLIRSPHCSRTTQTCVQERHGVCVQRRINWHCTEKLTNPGRARLTSQKYKIVSDRIVSGCQGQERRGDCARREQSCISGPATRTIKGMRVTRDCWQWRRRYECVGANLESDCQDLERDESCELRESECLEDGPGGRCASEEMVYSCQVPERALDQRQVCGSQVWCMGGDCNTVPRQPPNQSFGRAASAMNLLQEMGRDFSKLGVDSISVFAGEKASCKKWLGSLKNCCKVSGFLVKHRLAGCSEREKKLSVQRAKGQTHPGRRWCSREINLLFRKICVEKTEEYCAFKSRLGRILQQQARSQLGIGWGNCRGLSIAEIERVDWSRIDLSEVLGDIAAKMKPVEQARIKTEMKDKIRNHYDRIKAGISDNSTRVR